MTSIFKPVTSRIYCTYLKKKKYIYIYIDIMEVVLMILMINSMQ